ncbi:PAS domain S-box protein [Deinococcus sp. QL22]|uniref:PAS domain-containing sensor histidine kinase n=1 Tax=Deinococcus sp. QL22 TaxID=2939437 RepID=UPI002016E467|nr:PAS domain S-box protein [Deinococcus sp. QL22]UQN08765.1 PAS domain S-box protein [Deinococcus sp. QL22]
MPLPSASGVVSSHEQVLGLLDLIHGVVWETDPTTWRNTFVSAQLGSVLGYTAEEWTSIPEFWDAHVHPTDLPRVRAETEEHLTRGRPYEIEYRFQTADGRWIWLRDYITPVMEDGRLIKLGGVMLDVTEQKKNDASLRAAQDRFAKVFAASPVGIVLTGLHSGRVMESNDAFLKMLGVTREALIGSDNATLNPWVNPADRAEMLRQMQDGPLRDFETQHYHLPTMTARSLLVSAETLDFGGEEVLLLMAQDITARKEAEAAQALSENRFKALIQHSSDIVTVGNRGGYVIYTTPSMNTILGHAPEELVGKYIMDFMHPGDHAEIMRVYAEVVEGGAGTIRTCTNRFLHQEGHYVWMEWIASNRVADPHVRGVVMNARDVTERVTSDQALEESRRTFEALFEHSPDAILLVDFAGDMPILQCNEVAARMNGYTREEMIGQSTYVTLPDGEEFLGNPEGNEEFRALVRAGGSVHMETLHKRKDGSVFPVEIHLTLMTIGGREMMLSIERDITERKAAEEALASSQSRLLSSEKLASLGRLTAGLAHEINTPLASVMNALREARDYAQEYRDSVDVPTVTPDDHREIATDLLRVISEGEGSAARIGEFIRNMRSHTRDTVSGVQDFDGVKLAGDTLAMLAHQARNAKIALFLEQPKIPVTLRGEAGRFRQVVTNLVVNALHACEERGRPGSSVTVSFEAEDGLVLMRVADTGTGIPADVLPKIFDPMFTTKAVGKGTGLGLSIIYDIVQGHFKGHIDVETEQGVGTTFVVHFPVPALT